MGCPRSLALLYRHMCTGCRNVWQLVHDRTQGSLLTRVCLAK